MSNSKFIEYGWALQPAVVNEYVNLGTTNAHRIDLALKIWSCDVICCMHRLASLKIVADLCCRPSTRCNLRLFAFSGVPNLILLRTLVKLVYINDQFTYTIN